jgi:hypothetical protein
MSAFPRIGSREESALRRNDPQPMAVHPCWVSNILDSFHCTYYMEMLLPPEQETQEDQGWLAPRPTHNVCTPARSEFKPELEAIK